MKIYVSHAGSMNYEEELYRPLKDALPEHQLFLPHEPENVDQQAKTIIAESDLLIAEVSLPSTGQGIELGWADSVGTDILCFCKRGHTPSSSLRFVTYSIIEYLTPQEMTAHLRQWLSEQEH